MDGAGTGRVSRETEYRLAIIETTVNPTEKPVRGHPPIVSHNRSLHTGYSKTSASILKLCDSRY